MRLYRAQLENQHGTYKEKKMTFTLDTLDSKRCDFCATKNLSIIEAQPPGLLDRYDSVVPGRRRHVVDVVEVSTVKGAVQSA